MLTENFHASVQYNDFKGSAAADLAGQDDISDWLEKNELKQDGEFLLGISFFAGENHGKHEDPINVEVLLVVLGDHGNIKAAIDVHNGPVQVRKVTTEMPLLVFFGLFKRFHVTLSSEGVLEGQEYSCSCP